MLSADDRHCCTSECGCRLHMESSLLHKGQRRSGRVGRPLMVVRFVTDSTRRMYLAETSTASRFALNGVVRTVGAMGRSIDLILIQRFAFADGCVGRIFVRRGTDLVVYDPYGSLICSAAFPFPACATAAAAAAAVAAAAAAATAEERKGNLLRRG